jgi:hypothetical protein
MSRSACCQLSVTANSPYRGTIGAVEDHSPQSPGGRLIRSSPHSPGGFYVGWLGSIIVAPWTGASLGEESIVSEFGLVWRKSTRCETSKCVEVASNDHSHYIRDSKNPGQILDINIRATCGFIAYVRASTVANSKT